MQHRWVSLAEYTPTPTAHAAGMLDGPQLELLQLESELQEAGVPCVFEPRRPGENFAHQYAAMPPSAIRLMVREVDLQRAERLRGELFSG